MAGEGGGKHESERGESERRNRDGEREGEREAKRGKRQSLTKQDEPVMKQQ